MKRIIITALILVMFSGLGCIPRKKKQGEGLVEQKFSNLHFVGYKATFKVAAGPAQIDEYLLDLKNLDVETGGYRIRMDSKSRVEKFGDSVNAKMEILNVSIPGKFILTYHEPGKEICYVYYAKFGITGIVRFSLKEVGNATKVSAKFELEDINPFFSELSQAVNVPEMLGKLMDAGIARAQSQFDPSFQPEELPSKGFRGEIIDSLFQAGESSIWINASPKKVFQYLTDPQNAKVYNDKYGFGFAYCMDESAGDVCPFKIKMLGTEYELNSFRAARTRGESGTYYWVSKALLARIIYTVKPERMGTRLGLAYMVELPPSISEQGGDLILNVLQAPKALETMMTDIKASIEGTG